MLIQKEISHNKVNINGYSPGTVKIQGKEYTSPIALTSEAIILYQETASFEMLETEHLEALVEKDTELVIIGSGEKHQLISPNKIQSLNKKGIAVESMSTRNACHTFQVLVHENRKVIALLFP